MPDDRDEPTAAARDDNRGGMYCRECSYPLEQLTSCRCPECGYAFDPVDSDTCLPLPPFRYSMALKPMPGDCYAFRWSQEPYCPVNPDWFRWYCLEPSVH